MLMSCTNKCLTYTLALFNQKHREYALAIEEVISILKL